MAKDELLSGVLVIDKHAGVTSHHIISACRKLYQTTKVGHTGTLDPMATGVLPVLLGRAVKASDYLMLHDKEYICEMRLGLTTDTEDITGDTLTRTSVIPGEADVLAACRSLIGRVMQTPPMYSAVKVNGRKLVDIAREGGEVERTPREIEITELDAEKMADDRYRLRVVCSKGTYIRTLCADIGKKLGCGAVMASLIRTRTGEFTLKEAVSLEALEKMTMEERLALPKPVETLFEELPKVVLPDFYVRLCRGGADLYQKKLRVSYPDGTLLRLSSRDTFLALGRAMTVDGQAVVRPEKLFSIEPPHPPKVGRTAENGQE